MSPIVSKLKHDGYMEAVAVKQTDVFKAAEDFARLETILPAPESAHAIFQAMEEARKCAETGEEKTILFGLTGTGYFDMYAYEAYNKGEMTSTSPPTDEELEVGFATIPPSRVSSSGDFASSRDPVPKCALVFVTAATRAPTLGIGSRNRPVMWCGGRARSHRGTF